MSYEREREIDILFIVLLQSYRLLGVRKAIAGFGRYYYYLWVCFMCSSSMGFGPPSFSHSKTPYNRNFTVFRPLSRLKTTLPHPRNILTFFVTCVTPFFLLYSTLLPLLLAP